MKKPLFKTKIQLCSVEGEDFYTVPVDYSNLPRYIKHKNKLYKKWGWSGTLDHHEDYIVYLEAVMEIKTIKEIKGIKG